MGNYVERPFRKSTLPPSRLLVRYGFALAIAIIATSAIKLGQGFPQRFPGQTAIVESTITAGRGNCLAIWNQRTPDTSTACVTQRAGRPAIALIGDSHAAALGPGLRELASKDNWGVSIFTKSSCGPLLGVSIPHDKMPFFADACSAFMTEAFDGAAKAANIKVVILAGEWASYQKLGTTTLIEGLVSVREHIESSESFVIQGRWP